MITYKTDAEIETMRVGGEKLKRVMEQLVPQIHAGLTTNDINTLAEKYIQEQEADISFNKVKGYKWAVCVPINEQVVHTPPTKRILKNGDVLTVDIGAYYRGFHTDHAITLVVGGKSTPEIDVFLQVGKEALQLAIEQAQVGKRIGHISQAIEKKVVGAGYTIMKQLTGHGVGKELHEDPFIPGFASKPIEKTMKLRPGMVLALEVIYSMGSADIAYEEDQEWSIITADKSMSACFEHTVAITDKNTLVLT
ncbi:type I methionyl aminopeptidase [Candidatus Roizmanbacteria bacterium CG_4_10_14_3_um_filter_39_13]|uniref:Methionine aminopeptidase n=2 Tax=Candidatus Roizmaniibacteriota TaxID=1752723 RepID=A0A2H0KNA3_9BACT|nr:MAG: type I methionyl aminopeptidase [Candidatus Roizmanbacteria bacterium CG11_big_fil_rev_8_21_14_0_20_37_16]PIX68677.1 MAG: type I methionyl aminopeptidase [Candidatus Roizmanbacteria bacterium CG_4_10_14_3_um_filter_39_13]